LPVTLTDAVAGPCKKYDATAKLSAVVDEAGVPRDVYFLNPIGNDLDKMAVDLVSADRFRPGTHDGVPAAVAVSIEVTLPTCFVKDKEEAGDEVGHVRLRSVPIQKIDLQPPPPSNAMPALTGSSLPPAGSAPPEGVHPGARVTAPVLIKMSEAVYSDNGLRNRINGSCLIALIVDVHGVPQNLSIVKSLEPSLDQNALNAVSQYRFKPAMRNGTPVPVRITIEVDFHLSR
jgi:TonB family protein